MWFEQFGIAVAVAILLVTNAAVIRHPCRTLGFTAQLLCATIVDEGCTVKSKDDFKEI
jgi:hypothetical protein|tara:strand:- start:24 stop:197 length:174 start_codon:yes stop_codon:yes gene_type:complete